MKKQKGEIGYLILIPLFILLAAFVFDFILIFVQDTRLELATKNVIKNALTYNTNDYFVRVKEGYEDKKITTEHLSVEYEDGTLYVYNSFIYTSFFGKIIGKNKYLSEISMEGYKSGDDFEFKEVPR